MRAWTKWLGVATLGLLASNAVAADHGDGPAVQTDPATDITDIYSWMTPDNAKLILIMDVAGEFSANHLYAFHVSRQANAEPALLTVPSDETLVVCRFESTTSVECWAGGDYVTGDPSPNDGISSTSGAIKVHAAEHADPFFMFIDGFASAREEVLQYAGALPISNQTTGCLDTTVGHPEAAMANALDPLDNVDDALRGMLTGAYDDTLTALPNGAVDNFNGTDVWSIVLEVDKSLISGSGEYFQIWGSTNAQM